MSDARPTVFVVDDDASVRESLVKAHRGKMRKMNAGSLPELVRMADRLGDAA